MSVRRNTLLVLATLLGACSEDPEPGLIESDAQIDASAEVSDGTIDTTPDTAVVEDATDATPDADATIDASDADTSISVDAADASDTADTTVDAAEAASDATDAMEAASDTADAAEAASDSADAAEGASDSADAMSDTADGGSAPSEVWVVRVGDGAAALDTSSTVTFIDRFALPGGASLGSIAMPIAASGAQQPFTLAGDNFAAGLLHASLDGRYVTLAGYATAPGTASVTNTASTAVARVIARVDAARTIDTSTTTTSYSASTIRAVLTTDGTKFWLGGHPNGVSYLGTFGSSSAATTVSTGTTPNVGNVKDLTFFDGGLIGAATISSARLFEYPGVLPTTATNPTPLSGYPTGVDVPSSMIAFKRMGTNDLLYVCDENGNHLQRWAKESTVWTLKLNLTSTLCRGLAGYAQGTRFVLFTVAEGKLITLTDDPDSTTAPTPMTLATPATNTAFRGVALAPHL